MKMKYSCDLISDLLPLYKDEICSEASRKIIEEHLAECPDCKKMLNSLNDVTIDEKIVKEKEEVINTQARFFKRKSALAGSIIALIFAVPILICLIVKHVIDTSIIRADFQAADIARQFLQFALSRKNFVEMLPYPILEAPDL